MVPLHMTEILRGRCNTFGVLSPWTPIYIIY